MTLRKTQGQVAIGSWICTLISGGALAAVVLKGPGSSGVSARIGNALRIILAPGIAFISTIAIGIEVAISTILTNFPQ